MNDVFTFNFEDLLGNVSAAEKEQIYQEMAEDDVNTDIAEIYYSNIHFYYNGTEYWYSDGEDMIGALTVRRWDDIVVFADGISLDKGGLVFFPPES